MPQFFVEAPTGVQPDAKRKMMREITEAIDEAYGVADVRVWLREHPTGNVSHDGRIDAEPIKPVCFLEAPELASLDVKAKMAAKIHAAVDEAYRAIANTDETLILMNHYPLENVAAGGRLLTHDAEFVQAVAKLNA
ncbi:phenylpyruvate tautomerase PptA (4-oxalocrotonate tautomerase family) [Saccharothrix ecbatanensis]|jgi:phenylpyruvate tautomerase PptA (4-oxalocrotonate tautomerase family)|uniref:Phenylpyruvate tautomerase PptA (4-oxalocrotonate tautomerase family) n=1 Tax=Saccharothrix ecbatanensis TaxID=1105145 RepID=A0A7W9LY56_9PSEU|nr:N-acetylmuramic acid 6-phosphate etherase [Saccharothrix ecbatanensis]MBB5800368.1 phenylpyruvate tautomerase PptA (4-oxalocrotonate tautomerase family) [Saccharothrix ecbatanensis]